MADYDSALNRLHHLSSHGRECRSWARRAFKTLSNNADLKATPTSSQMFRLDARDAGQVIRHYPWLDVHECVQYDPASLVDDGDPGRESIELQSRPVTRRILALSPR